MSKQKSAAPTPFIRPRFLRVFLANAWASTALLVVGGAIAADPPVGAAAASQPAPQATAPAAAKLAAVAGQKPKSSKAAKSPDRLELDKTVVTGNRELPKVLYIVPWKRAGLGDLPAPFNTLLDEALTPVDRDVFRRELHYYDALEAGAGQANASGQVGTSGTSGQGEK